MATGDKLTELNPITSSQISKIDVFYIVDVDTDTSKKITATELLLYIENELLAIEQPTLIQATPGGSLSYSGANSIIYTSWSGGSGTFNLILPSATDIPYRTIKIICDGTVSANDKIHVLAPVGESIDGALNPGFYTLNKPYNGVTIWSDGSNWIVIQAKAT